MKIEFYVNGEKKCIEADPKKRLLDILHDDFELIEIKEGCGNGECGACTVLLDGRRVNSCLIPALQLPGVSIITISGLKQLPAYHKIEKAYVEYGAVQCGFCMGGFMMSTAVFLRELDKIPTHEEILEAFGGNLCRCTGYTKIIDAIKEVANNEKLITQLNNDWDKTFGETLDKIHHSPVNLLELNSLIQNCDEKTVFIAGATDLMVQKHKLENRKIIDLSKVKDLTETIEISEKGILMGASVPIADIIDHNTVQNEFPILTEALKQIGAPQIQNRATLGGNIANASPAGDSMPPLAVLNAELWIGPAQNGQYEKQTISEVMLGPGQNSMTGNKYIAFVFIPFPENKNLFWYYRKVGQRKAMAISKLSVALVADKIGGNINDIRICAGSVSPQIKRAAKTEAVLKNKKLNEEVIEAARKIFIEEVTPITDIRSTKGYRKNICGEVLRDALYGLKNK